MLARMMRPVCDQVVREYLYVHSINSVDLFKKLEWLIFFFLFLTFSQQIKVTLNDEDMDTFVFAVGNRKAMARMQKELQDLVRTHFLSFVTNRSSLSPNYY